MKTNAFTGLESKFLHLSMGIECDLRRLYHKKLRRRITLNTFIVVRSKFFPLVLERRDINSFSVNTYLKHSPTNFNKSTIFLRGYVEESFVGFEALIAVVMKSSVFWDITSCRALKVNLNFE
jgi:hypothetical protein